MLLFDRLFAETGLAVSQAAAEALADVAALWLLSRWIRKTKTGTAAQNG